MDTELQAVSVLWDLERTLCLNGMAGRKGLSVDEEPLG